MADRGHANANQVLGRQARQNISVEIVVTERFLVSLET
jgi:hypothetical protein